MAQKKATKAKGARRAVPARRTGSALVPFAGWEPERLLREMDRMLEDFRRRLPWPSFWPERWPEFRVEMPAVDVYDRPEEVVVKAELPGLSKDQIEVSLTDDTLTIRGEKKKEEEVREEDYYRAERAFGRFSRTIELPAAVKADEVRATFKDGVLEVHLPKEHPEAAKAKKIEVQ